MQSGGYSFKLIMALKGNDDAAFKKLYINEHSVWYDSQC